MGNKSQNANLLREKAIAQLCQTLLKNETVLYTAAQLQYELQVYQIELKMQNEELQRANFALWEERNRYANLYDFAPVGYLTLTSHGLISEINLTATELLSMNRQKLLNVNFASFVAPQDSDRWYLFSLDVMKHNERRNIELTLKKNENTVSHFQIACQHIISHDDNSMLRLSLTDISEHKRMEDELKIRIAERDSAMASLKQSRQYLENSINELSIAKEAAEKANIAKNTLSTFISTLDH
jgi:PAS domain S-box-containing protein